jgi:hypothetical protein
MQAFSPSASQIIGKKTMLRIKARGGIEKLLDSTPGASFLSPIDGDQQEGYCHLSSGDIRKPGFYVTLDYEAL